MASAVLVNRNEPCWGERKVYMRKYPNTVATTSAATAVSNDNAHFNVNPHHNPGPYNQNQRRHPSTNLHVNDTPSTASGLPTRKPLTSHEAQEVSRDGHVTFNLDAYTRQELKDLKSRLLSELQQVRIMRTRIESTNFETRSNNQTTPPAIVQVSHATDPQQTSRNCTPKGRKKGRGSKRANPFGNSGHNLKRTAKDPSAGNVISGMMKKCRQILGKLMKYKHGWVFNTPVDVVAFGLHDYHAVIQTPMDLGTVKSNLDKNVYKSPLEFASDVRLTFNNALKYNPKGHDVHSMAETLLAKFEGMFNPVSSKIEENSEANKRVTGIEKKKSTGRTKTEEKREVKKRVMSTEEKKTLGRSLVELPQEKMVELLDMLNKRNISLAQDGGEFVLDIEALDGDTLLELDGFISDYKKTVVNMMMIETSVAAIEKLSGEEDVDIGEEIPVEYYPPVEIEKDDNASTNSRSSSSGSDDTSSSSGSDSGNSSDDNDSANET
ncbi:hypothetical protein Ddye_009724 [Dipteronia dyeriana]|uniref:Uncharacterized protein n=1 Tax=Dipteronia dyeriana TaxID=168575 RepID=A0AAD9XCC8_9ROSI|nr:hypothetical protein Ddye_009724 [Dipteronia dyeriana]